MARRWSASTPWWPRNRCVRALSLAEKVLSDARDLDQVGGSACMLACWFARSLPQSLRRLLQALCDGVEVGDFGMRYASAFAALALHRATGHNGALVRWSKCGFGFGITPVQPQKDKWERWMESSAGKKQVSAAPAPPVWYREGARCYSRSK